MFVSACHLVFQLNPNWKAKKLETEINEVLKISFLECWKDNFWVHELKTKKLTSELLFKILMWRETKIYHNLKVDIYISSARFSISHHAQLFWKLKRYS
jgi:hypothetical protein